MIGEKLGSFKVEAVLGTGAMGVVYRAVHESTGKVAAVKVISGETAHKGKSYERFKLEAEILQQFRHPNIVRFFAFGRYQGTNYFAMEFVPGSTLEQLLASKGPLDWREVVDLGIQICEALHYAHQRQIVHRDLKPSNLMVSEKGQIKLTDFGIAKDLDENATALTATGRTLGTAAYMAPEQIRGHPAVSHKTDLYALGVVLFQLLTGRLPFEGPSAVAVMHCHLNETPPKASAKVAEIPVALDDLIDQLMSKVPAERPWDAAAVSLTLTKLRDRANRGAAVKMVWPTDKSGAIVRAGEVVPERPRRIKDKAKGEATQSGFALPAIDRGALSVVLLVLALCGIGGLIAYIVLPPSARYLHQQAERLMTSDDRLRWKEALDEYITPLDRRFPDHPYKEQTRAWRDAIALYDAERRAARLDSPIRTPLTDPQTPSEHQYFNFSRLAADARQRGDDLAAARFWDELAKVLNPSATDERPWHLLARKRADELAKTILIRRQAVLTHLQRALDAETAGRTAEAASIRTNLVNDYGRYTDVAELLGLTSKPGPDRVTPGDPR